MTETSQGRSKDAFAPFPRWLPLLGFGIGVIYLLILKFAGVLFGDAPEKLDFELARIGYSGPADEISCELLGQPGTILEPPVFKSSNGDKPDVFWVRTQANQLPQVLVFDRVPDVVIFMTCADGVAVGPVYRAGDTLPTSDRQIAKPNIAFPLTPFGDDTAYLLYVVQGAALSFPLSVQTRATFDTDSDRKLKIHIGFSSAIAFMALYNIILSIMTRMPAFAFNALVISSLLLHNIYLSGVGAAYLWPEHPNLSNFLLLVGVAGPSLFGPFYLYRFIVPTDQHLLTARPMILIWPAFALLCLSASAFVPYYYLALPLILSWIGLAVVGTFHLSMAFYQGNDRAGVLLVAAFGAALPAMAAGAAKEFWGYEFGGIAPHLTEFALLLEALLFTLALAYQIRVSRWRELEALNRLNLHSEVAKQQLLDTIDSDRTRLASDLHDSAGQMLGLISSRLKKAALNGKLSDAQSADLHDTAALASETLSEIRRMSHDLHPATLTHLGLKQALQTLCKNVTDAGQVRIDCQLSFDDTRLNDQQNLQVYRIVQELIANTVRHSNASDAMLSVHSAGTRFQLGFSDNGQTPTASDVGDGIGRTILRERVARLGGELSVRVGTLGTAVTVDFIVEPFSKGGTR